MKAKKILFTFMVALAGGLFAIGTSSIVKDFSSKRTSVQPEVPVQLASYSNSARAIAGSMDFTITGRVIFNNQVSW